MSNWRDFVYFWSKDKMPTAPSAKERFNNGKVEHYTPNFRPWADNKTIITGKSKGWNYFAPEITKETFSETGDTIYTETPSYRFLTKPKTRKASNKDIDRSEYNIMERRFNEALEVRKRPSLDEIIK